MIVSYDEHDVKNTFKFGVIYQKAKQVSTTCPYWALYPVDSHWGLFISSPKDPYHVLKYVENHDFKYELDWRWPNCHGWLPITQKPAMPLSGNVVYHAVNSKSSRCLSLSVGHKKNQTG